MQTTKGILCSIVNVNQTETTFHEREFAIIQSMYFKEFRKNTQQMSYIAVKGSISQVCEGHLCGQKVYANDLCSVQGETLLITSQLMGVAKVLETKQTNMYMHFFLFKDMGVDLRDNGELWFVNFNSVYL